MKRFALTLLLGIVQILTCTSQIDQPKRINGYYCWDVANTNKIIEYEIYIAECDSLEKIYALEISSIKSELKVTDSIAANLQKQIDAEMNRVDLCLGQKTLLINDYNKLQADYNKELARSNRLGKLTTGLIVGGVVVVVAVVPVIIYAILK